VTLVGKDVMPMKDERQTSVQQIAFVRRKKRSRGTEGLFSAFDPLNELELKKDYKHLH
jgi:hypothetical protein